jgi:uracil phosphoribosyltransferase
MNEQAPEGITIVGHPLVQSALTRLRRRDTPTGEFRRLVHELGMFLTFVASGDLPTSPITVQTPIAEAEGVALAGREPCIVSILRAGNGLLDGALAAIPDAVVGFVGLRRNETTLAPEEYYFNVPPHLDERWVLLVDPMLATGHSAARAVARLREAGVRTMRFVCLLAARPGLETFRAQHPDIPIVTAGIDETLSESGFIVPGLGDAGDRIFGTM